MSVIAVRSRCGKTSGRRKHKAADDEACQRLTAIPGIGSVTATALVAAIGSGSGFRKGAIWRLGCPREYSTGGKQRMSCIYGTLNKPHVLCFC